MTQNETKEDCGYKIGCRKVLSQTNLILKITVLGNYFYLMIVICSYSSL